MATYRNLGPGPLVPPMGRMVKPGQTFAADPAHDWVRIMLAGKPGPRIELIPDAEAGGPRTPESIGDLSPRECKRIIACEADRGVLERWAEVETRPTVKVFLAERLKALRS